MRILAVDGECLALEGLCAALRSVAPQAEVYPFNDGDDALAAVAAGFVPDVAFVDRELRGTNGLSVARRLQEHTPRVNVIFVTSYTSYMGDAFSLYASGYVTKPVMAERLSAELSHLRYPVGESRPADGPAKLVLRTFGDFAVFCNGAAVPFSYSKTLELLALLTDAQGALCTMSKLQCQLRETLEVERPDAYLRNLLRDMRACLRKAGCGNVLLRSRGIVGIDRTKVSCDLFDALDGKPGTREAFRGEYMSQYSWAEPTLGMLVRLFS